MFASTAYSEQQPATCYPGTAAGPTDYQPAQPAVYPEAGTQAVAYQQTSLTQGAAYQQAYDSGSAVSTYSTYDPPVASASYDPPAARTGYTTPTDYSSTHAQQGYAPDTRFQTTVYVGGLPMSAPAEGDGEPRPQYDEATLHNFFFSNCGIINTIRLMGNKNFCYIEFEAPEAASAAVLLSGCQAALNPEDPTVLTRLIVKPAHQRAPMSAPEAALPFKAGGASAYDQAAAPQYAVDAASIYVSAAPVAAVQSSYEAVAAAAAAATGGYGGNQYWQQQQQQQQQQQPAQLQPQQQQQQQGAPQRSPSPPQVAVRYTDAECRRVKEVLRGSEDQGEFHTAVRRVARWLEGGDCNKKTADHFHTCLQTIAARARAFRQLKEERHKAHEAEEQLWAHTLIAQCEAMAAAMEAAKLQRVRDVMSRTQRKNLEQWNATVTEVLHSFRKLGGFNVEEAESVTPPPPPPVPVEGGKRKRSDRGDEEGKAVELEAMLSSRDGLIRTLTSRVAALEAELAARPAPPSPSAPTSNGTSARPTPLRNCILSALSVYLTAHPQGAPISDLALYITKISSPSPLPAGSPPSARAIALVSDVLSDSPGVFRRADTGLGEPLWSMSALHSLPQLLQGAKPA